MKPDYLSGDSNQPKEVANSADESTKFFRGTSIEKIVTIFDVRIFEVHEGKFTTSRSQSDGVRTVWNHKLNMILEFRNLAKNIGYNSCRRKQTTGTR